MDLVFNEIIFYVILFIPGLAILFESPSGPVKMNEKKGYELEMNNTISLSPVGY